MRRQIRSLNVLSPVNAVNDAEYRIVDITLKISLGEIFHVLGYILADHRSVIETQMFIFTHYNTSEKDPGHSR